MVSQLVSRTQVKQSLFISESQLKRDIQLLEKLKPMGWRYRPGSRELNLNSFEILYLFRSILAIAGKKKAIAAMNNLPKARRIYAISQDALSKIPSFNLSRR